MLAHRARKENRRSHSENTTGRGSTASWNVPPGRTSAQSATECGVKFALARRVRGTSTALNDMGGGIGIYRKTTRVVWILEGRSYRRFDTPAASSLDSQLSGAREGNDAGGGEVFREQIWGGDSRQGEDWQGNYEEQRREGGPAQEEGTNKSRSEAESWGISSVYSDSSRADSEHGAFRDENGSREGTQSTAARRWEIVNGTPSEGRGSEWGLGPMAAGSESGQRNLQAVGREDGEKWMPASISGGETM